MRIPAADKLVAFFGLLVAMAGCVESDKSETLRLEANIETDRGVFSGSGVQQFECHSQNEFLESLDTDRCRIVGEAIPVRISPQQTVYLLLRHPTVDTTSFASRILRAGDQLGQGINPGDLEPSWILEPAEMPMIVAFRDSENPATVFQVDPEQPPVLGDVSLRAVSMKVSRVSGPTTRGIVVQKLPWLKNLRTLLDGQISTSSNQLSSRLGRSDFIVEK